MPWSATPAPTADAPSHVRGAALSKDQAPVDIPLDRMLDAAIAARVAGRDLRTATRHLLGRAVRIGAEQIRREDEEQR